MRLGARAALSTALVAAVAATWDSLASLESHWRTVKSYEHGYLVGLLATTWLARALWRSHAPIAASLAASSAARIGVLAAAMLAWLVAQSAQVNMLHQLLFPIVLWCAVACVAGFRGAAPFAWPIGLWYFAMPVWDYALPWLQGLSVFVAQGAMREFGIPVQVDENRISIPEGIFSIDEGCAGLRYLLMALTVAYMARAVFAIRLSRFVPYLLACIVMALIANWVRICIVIYAGHVTQMQSYLVAVEHVTLGNAIFLPLLGAILWTGHALSAPDAAPAIGPAGRPVGQPVAVPQRALVSLGIVLVMALGLGLLRWHALDPAGPSSTASLQGLPLSFQQWQGPLPVTGEWRPEFAAATAEVGARYVDGAGRSVHVYINVYASQDRQRKLVAYGNRLISANGWAWEWPRDRQRLVVPDAVPAVLEIAKDRYGHKWLIGHAYRIGGAVTTSDAVAQLSYGARAILRSTPAGVVAFAVQCEMNCESAHKVASDFWGQLSMRLLAIIPER